MVYPSKNLTYEGLELEVLEEIAKEQNFSYEVHFTDYNQAFADLQKGRVSAAIGGFALTDEKREDFLFADAIYQRDGIDFGMVLSKKESKLLSKYNIGLKNIKKNGVYERILQKYTHKE